MSTLRRSVTNYLTLLVIASFIDIPPASTSTLSAPAAEAPAAETPEPACVPEHTCDPMPHLPPGFVCREINVKLSENGELDVYPEDLTICQKTVIVWESGTPGLHIIGVFGLSGETFDDPRSYKPPPSQQSQQNETSLSWRSTDHYNEKSHGHSYYYSLVVVKENEEVKGGNVKIFYKDPQVTNRPFPMRPKD